MGTKRGTRSEARSRERREESATGYLPSSRDSHARAMRQSRTTVAREHPSLRVNACTPGFIETHRHNYSTELKPETHKKIDSLIEGKTTVSGMSCEDLCMLDEAKKRNADKVLVYHILSMGSNKLTIHYRLSDVKTGAIEASHTISVNHPTSSDTSFIEAP